MASNDRSAATGAGTLRLILLDGFQLLRGGSLLRFPAAAQRLLAVLALRHAPMRRHSVAGTLWPDVDEDRAEASLRSALWRVRRSEPSLIDATRTDLRLGPDVRVDYPEARRLATAIMDGGSDPSHDDHSWEQLASDLLPDWQEEWVTVERERFRQLRVHALETLCERFSAEGRHGEAIQAGFLAVSCEPLRESAQRILIAALLAEGNRSSAVRQLESYRMQLITEIGEEPSNQTVRLVDLSKSAKDE
jgi:DNA-binding SARP family transcriptional activator